MNTLTWLAGQIIPAGVGGVAGALAYAWRDKRALRAAARRRRNREQRVQKAAGVAWAPRHGNPA